LHVHDLAEAGEVGKEVCGKIESVNQSTRQDPDQLLWVRDVHRTEGVARCAGR
jgi:hypothetical protein